jgi:NADH-quinone oxidoreductase subunit G
MSDTANTETVTITVDGVEMQAPKGAMLIEVTDAHNIKVPRFCYHKKLAIAANCRMCLVEVEKAPKPLPACATPVMDGMVVHTHSKLAKDAQKSVMEFLLINHPLDCPICDQGGECELQDVAMGYGQDVSQYVEAKRVVFDKNIGPLIATELTRCIHCTRCVRFGREIAGIRELGMTGRGENALISTFVDECVNSEMSGNSIDVCPVGALTARPSRYAARAWEVVQHKTIAPHDCIGSNLFVHTLRGEVVRVVPRENEAINEVWISDRDRFSYEGLSTEDRLTTPMVKRDGAWQQASWDDALKLVADRFKAAAEVQQAAMKEAEQAAQKAAEASSEDAEQEPADEAAQTEVTQTEVTQAEPATVAELAALVSPSSTLEEQYLTQKLMRALGSGNIDSRLRQADFSDQDIAPVMPWLGQSIEQLEQLDAALLIGSNVRKEQPIANLRLRKAVVNRGAQVSFLNNRLYDFNFPVANNIAVAPQNMVAELAAIASAVFAVTKADVPGEVVDVVKNAKAGAVHKAIAKSLADAGADDGAASIILGSMANMHPQLSSLRTLANAIAKATGARLGYLTDGCNAAGGWLAGALPHRGAGGNTEDVITGMPLDEITTAKLAACMLVNIEPDTDVADARALMSALDTADFVVSVSAYNSASLRKVADVMLPAAVFTETSGTYVNAEGYWQSFAGVLKPAGEARPAWKVLRVLANLCGAEGFDFMSSEDVRKECRSACEDIELSNDVVAAAKLTLPAASDLQRSADLPMYATDAIVRRAGSLQKTVDAQSLCIRMNNNEAARLGIAAASQVKVSQGDASALLDLVLDDSIPDASANIPIAVEGNDLLGAAYADITVEAKG